MSPVCTLHVQLHLLAGIPDIDQKFLDMFEALSGMGLVEDAEIGDVLTENQTKAIVLEYVSRIYKGSGNLYIDVDKLEKNERNN